jgi:hypothetical protein
VQDCLCWISLCFLNVDLVLLRVFVSWWYSFLKKIVVLCADHNGPLPKKRGSTRQDPRGAKDAAADFPLAEIVSESLSSARRGNYIGGAKDALH